MARNLKALGLWRAALVASVRQDGPDLSARQLAILLQVYLTDPPHTVRGLAALLNISKPAVTRALDRLSVLSFVKRKRDTEDKRNVLVQRTVRGSVFLSDFAELVIAAGAVTEEDMAVVRAEEALALAAKNRLEAALKSPGPATPTAVEAAVVAAAAVATPSQ
ncbi:MarR family transcriptional regulator [Azospirillum griseum]|uniref:MarR family transcriptional regulator n=1 Tax=Azospirillum griseum TaxID=2496639 RepID=A0A431VG52_9PROT|nr:MarR family transcriptional regulator [Azospirillum griseum]